MAGGVLNAGKKIYIIIFEQKVNGLMSLLGIVLMKLCMILLGAIVGIADGNGVNCH